MHACFVWRVVCWYLRCFFMPKLRTLLGNWVAPVFWLKADVCVLAQLPSQRVVLGIGGAPAWIDLWVLFDVPCSHSKSLAKRDLGQVTA